MLEEFPASPVVVSKLRGALDDLCNFGKPKGEINLGGFIHPLIHASMLGDHLAAQERIEAEEPGETSIKKFQDQARSLLDSLENLSSRTWYRLPCDIEAVCILHAALEAVSAPCPTGKRKGPARNPTCVAISRQAFVIYMSIVGRVPTRSSDRGPYGAFYDFLTKIFSAFDLDANAEHYAKMTIADHKRARMEGKQPFSTPFAP